MNLTELKRKSAQQILDIAQDIGVENIKRSRTQELILPNLIRKDKAGERSYGYVVLENLHAGYGF